MKKKLIFIPLCIMTLIQFTMSCDFIDYEKSELRTIFNDDNPGIQIDKNRYRQNLAYIAQWRTPGSEHWQSVQDHCAEVFHENGFEVEKHSFKNGVNIIGRLKGLEKPEESVIIGAHYDHIQFCDGADDNASGVSGVLEAAHILGPLGPFDRSLTLICFDQEENDLEGSKAFVSQNRSALKGLVAAYVFESIGYTVNIPNTQEVPKLFRWVFSEQTKRIEDHGNRGDFIAIVANKRSNEAVQLLNNHADEIGLKALSFVPPVSMEILLGYAGLGRSDHFPFWKKKLPALMITDTANHRNPNYHCSLGSDQIKSIDFDFAEKVVNMTLRAAHDQVNNIIPLR